MGVISQMQRDLENRQRQEAAHVAQAMISSSKQSRGSIPGALWMVIAGLAMIALLIWGLIKTGHLAIPAMINSVSKLPAAETQMNNPQPLPQSTPPVSEYVPTPPPLVVPKTPPLVMEAIDWKINKQAMAMSFRLPSKINYEVVVDDKKNIVTLTFPHTVFDGNKPLILLENEFADKLEKIQDGDFLQVKAYLKPNTSVAYVDYMNDSNKPTLVMSLSRKASSVNPL